MRELTLADNGWCFGCGKNNPIGLKLEFQKEGDDYIAEFVPLKEHQGYSGITHGGIVAAVLDEAMGRLAWQEGCEAVTAEMTLRLKRPAPTGAQLQIRGSIIREQGKRVYCAAEARNEDGQVVAEASAVMVKVGGVDENR